MRGTRAAATSAIGLLGAALLLTGCGDTFGASSEDTAGDATELRGQAPDGAYAAGDGPVAGLPTSPGGQADEASGGDLSGVTLERSVIAVADMTLRSEDVADAVSVVESVATSLGGFVSGQDVSSNPDDPTRSRATVVVRIPTSKLDTAIDRMQEAGELVRVTSDARDVTEQVVDVDSRVASARASVERIRALLSEATTIGEVVRIESELARREADLESLLAQQRALADQTAMATLSVTLLAPAAVEPPPEDETGFVPGLERGWEALVDVVVVALTTLGVLLPFLVVALLVIGPIAAAWQRRRRQRSAVSLGEAVEERDPEAVH